MSQLEFLAYANKRATYRVVGGPRQFFATFYRTDDLTDEQLERREEFARDVLAIKPLRRRSSKVDHARARARLEAAGSKAIAEADRATPEELASSKGRKWLVRIYYWSEGGELLCFDAGPYHRATADRVAGEHAPQDYRPRQSSPPSAEVFDRDQRARAIAQGDVRRPVRGARLVVLPSQRAEKTLDVAAENGEG